MLNKSKLLGVESSKREFHVLNLMYESSGKIAKYSNILNYMNTGINLEYKIKKDVLDIIIRDLEKHDMIENVKNAFRKSYKLTDNGIMVLAELNYK